MPDVADTPSLAQLIKLGLRGALAGVETVLPGRVTQYDHAAQRASVQPLIQGAYLDRARELAYEDLPVIHNCPVAFFAAGHASLTSKLEVGDRVTLLFCSRDIAGWLTNDSERNQPNDPRRHALDDVVVIPGVRSFKTPLPSGAVSDTDTVLAADAIQLGSSAAEFFIVLDVLLANWINTNIKNAFDNHVHSVIPTAMPAAPSPVPTGPPVGVFVPPGPGIPSTIPTLDPDDINSEKVRSE